MLLGIVAAIGAFMPPYAASQRVILPELVGEDVTTMAQANSLLEGGFSAAGLIGPALAGILIPFLGAPNVLYIDAATYLVAFLLVLLFVPRPKPLDQEAGGGLLEGLRFVARDSFMGALVLVIVVFGFFSSALSAALPAHAYLDFGSPRIAGLFYSALGAGALVGTIIAVMLIPKTAAPAAGGRRHPRRFAAVVAARPRSARRGSSRSRSSRPCCSRRSSTGPCSAS